MCQRPATSREHIPPKCFFPGKGELPLGRDCRINLITVPSCDLHNISKSGDDQYVLMVIVSHWQNNAVAYQHFSSKVLRAIARRPALRQFYIGEFVPAIVGGKPTAAFTIDRQRFDRSMARIASGLYFDEYGQQWRQELSVESPALLALGGVNREQRSEVLQALHVIPARHLGGDPWRGDNPEIFQYRIYRDILANVLLVQMLFYEGFLAYAWSLPKWGSPLPGLFSS